MKRALWIMMLMLFVACPVIQAQEPTPPPNAATPEALPPLTAEDSFQLAVKAFQSGDLAGSERHARTAIALKSRYVEAHYLLGRILVFRAAQKTRLLIEQRGDAGAVLPREANWPAGENELQDAIAQFRTVIKLDPSNTDAWLLLATALDNLGQNEDAVNAYRQTINLNPASRNARDAHNNLGLVFRQQKKFEEAKDEFEAALALDPTFQPARLNLEKLKKQKPKLLR